VSRHASHAPRDPTPGAQALADLRAGAVTAAVIRTVTTAARAVARTGRFTAPNGSRTWSQHDVDDLVGDFFAVPGRILNLATRAGDGPDGVTNFRRAVETSLKRVIIDRFRAGPVGVLHKRIDRRMRVRTDIQVVAPQHWARTTWVEEPHWGGDDEQLVAAANAVAIDPSPAWSDDSLREPPATTTHSLDAACDAVLDEAACPVPQPTVCRVVANRVIPFNPAYVAESPDTDSAEEAEPDVKAADDAAAAQAADVFWQALDNKDRLLLPNLRVPARQLADDGLFDLKKSAIDTRQRRLEEHLTTFAATTPDPELAVRHILRLRESWQTGQIGEGAP
jgi:hypothetical protein